MPTIEIELEIEAPPERVFDLARSVELHLDSTGDSGEKVVAGRKEGLLGQGEDITWSARHLGVRQRLTSRMVSVDRPRHFRDSMIAGAFKRFDHDHFFEPIPGGTRLRDRFDYDSPFGVLGRLADRWFLEEYMRRFLTERMKVIKRVAESEEWRRYLL